MDIDRHGHGTHQDITVFLPCLFSLPRIEENVNKPSEDILASGTCTANLQNRKQGHQLTPFLIVLLCVQIFYESSFLEIKKYIKYTQL
jgi:hypothetical protein